ncbi:hypothetical protein BGZ61DRAFT_499456 [Ilyonectria robusta]|uniref:uncharacterized protein n=1 Tax=Ilyonectria robusta TaxID=1079257 RepID=UPI001E8DAD72|nr:uncharacterized protein BGZ61DRAFT_499456 [Ilyonectria robusta]KAH8661781.1 hypothetical protein BGZ61DRAFT_499456 [Ilyonectria robusta]
MCVSTARLTHLPGAGAPTVAASPLDPSDRIICSITVETPEQSTARKTPFPGQIRWISRTGSTTFSSLFTETEEAHEKALATLCKEFDDQRAIPAAQWARCFIRKYRNFSIRVTSGTQASNNIKTYLLNGIDHLYRLIEAIQDMMKDQERDFNDACAADEVLTSREYIGSSSEYLGELRTVLSSKGLGLITKQCRLVKKALSTRKNPFPDPLMDCSEDCSVSTEVGIPCCHKIYSKLGSGTPFTKWEVHPRIATALRGRAKNITQAIPARLAIEANSQPSSQPASQKTSKPGTRASTLPRLALEASQQASIQASSQASTSSQRQTRSQSAVLGAERTTGARACGRKTQPSIRRRRSQWELLDSDEEVLPCIVVRG